MQGMKSNIFTETISRFRSNTTVQELTEDFKTQLKVKIFKRSTLQPEILLKKYSAIQRRYAKAKNPRRSQEWQENERKLFLWFILAYSRLHFKKLCQITSKEWSQISACFGNKNINLMKYETKSMERNSERVRWTPSEENILISCIRSQLNGRWAQISKVLFFKTDGECYKTPKQCRQHWLNHMDQEIKRGSWTVDEDLIILHNVMAEGHHWSKIVDLLPTKRTEHMVKNRFGSLVSCARKLLKIENQLITQSKLMEYLINELRNNRQFVVHSKSRQQVQEESYQDSEASDFVKKEESNSEICQKTELENKSPQHLPPSQYRKAVQTNSQMASPPYLESNLFPLAANPHLRPTFPNPTQTFSSFLPNFSLSSIPSTVSPMQSFFFPREIPPYQPNNFLAGAESISSLYPEYVYNFADQACFPSAQNLKSLSEIKIPPESSEIKIEPTCEP